MNQRGFATIFGLCLILVIALIVKGIQAAEFNHIHETSDFQTEIDLQNAADGGIYEAVEEVRLAEKNDGEILLTVNPNPELVGSRQANQVKLITTKKNSAHAGEITVEVWGERINMHQYKVDYEPDPDVARKRKQKVKGKYEEIFLDSYFFFSIARATNQHTGGEVYRRSTAYVSLDYNTLQFMELPMSDYTFEK